MKIFTVFLVGAALFILEPYTACAQALNGTTSNATMATRLEAPAMIRDTVVVNTGVIRLGDLFVNAGPNADKVIAYAPEPGRKAIYDVRWLSRAASIYGVRWRPMSMNERVVVERASRVISRSEIEDYLLSSLIGAGANPDLKLKISNSALKLYIPQEDAPSVAVEDLNYDSLSNRFSAFVSAPAGDPSAQRVRVVGRMVRMTDIPVLTHNMRTGEIVRKDDISWIQVESDRVQRNVLTDADGLIGMAARRDIRARLPIRNGDVRRPILVPKGSLVTMILHMNSMTLTAKGRALEAGSLGDAIRVANTHSNTVIDATVSASGTVSVRITPAPTIALR